MTSSNLEIRWSVRWTFLLLVVKLIVEETRRVQPLLLVTSLSQSVCVPILSYLCSVFVPLRRRRPRSRSTPSGRLCPNWETFTSTMLSAPLTGPTGEPPVCTQSWSVKDRNTDVCDNFLCSFLPPDPLLSSSSSSVSAPWWEWIFLRRRLVFWWRRSLTTLPWLWRNPTGPSWPSWEGENCSFELFIRLNFTL